MECSYILKGEVKGSPVIKKTERSITFFTPCPGKLSCSPYEINLSKGFYMFEAWGSIGGQHSNSGTPGLGGYVKGNIFLNKQSTFYLYIGSNGGFNAGNYHKESGGRGGGASDVRLEYNEKWYDFNSLKSRIFIAGGGGGSEWSYSLAGNGGGLVGGNGIALRTSTSTVYWVNGSSQTGPGEVQSGITFDGITDRGVKGKFGISGFYNTSNDLGGCGGGGYYGGSSMDYAGAGSGGSSFISGHEGCNALSIKSTDFEDIKHTDQSAHYSMHVFKDTKMIQGNQTMPMYNEENGIGNKGEGVIRITLLMNYFSCRKISTFQIQFSIFCFLLVIKM